MARTVLLFNPPAVARSKIFFSEKNVPRYINARYQDILFSNMFFSLAPFPRKVPSFHPSYPTPVYQLNIKRNRVTERPLQTLLRYVKPRQLLFQSIAVLPDDDARRRCIVQPLRFILQSLSAPRRRGLPKQMWVSDFRSV